MPPTLEEGGGSMSAPQTTLLNFIMGEIILNGAQQRLL